MGMKGRDDTVVVVVVAMAAVGVLATRSQAGRQHPPR
jgi:hypothetical protein